MPAAAVRRRVGRSGKAGPWGSWRRNAARLRKGSIHRLEHLPGSQFGVGQLRSRRQHLRRRIDRGPEAATPIGIEFAEDIIRLAEQVEGMALYMMTMMGAASASAALWGRVAEHVGLTMDQLEAKVAEAVEARRIRIAAHAAT